MRRIVFRLTRMVILILLLLSISACSQQQRSQDTEKEQIETMEAIETQIESEASDENVDKTMEEEITMNMTINDTSVSVAWENNESVKALVKLTEDGPVTIQMNAYGGFEQVGSIGQSLPSNDISIKTKAGDIMLYTSDHIVIFYGSNSWSYTKLGRITDKSKDELAELLKGQGVTVTIDAK